MKHKHRTTSKGKWDHAKVPTCQIAIPGVGPKGNHTGNEKRMQKPRGKTRGQRKPGNRTMNEMHQVTPETNNCTRKEEQYKRLQQPGTLPKARKGSHYDKAEVKLISPQTAKLEQLRQEESPGKYQR